MRKILRRLRRDMRIAALCRRVAPFGGREYIATFVRAVRICDKERLAPEEAFFLGLFRNDVDEAGRRKMLSRKKLTKLQKGVNPVSWSPLLKNKSVFYKYCLLHKIIVPELYAVFFKDIAGWCSQRPNVLGDREQWTRYIAEELPDEFVVKPSVGAHGEGVGIFMRNCAGFVDAGGLRYNAEGVWRFIRDNSDTEGYVVQQRIRNHGRIENLTASEFLQTVRVITHAGCDRGVEVLHGHLKLTGEDNIVDNFGDGLDGNIQCRVDLPSGKLSPAVGLAADGSGIMVVEKHPQTRICFAGFELPFWDEVCGLVKAAAGLFLPIRSIGWDVAIGPNGPVIIEGNIWWDPHNQHRTMDRIRDCLGGA